MFVISPKHFGYHFSSDILDTGSLDMRLKCFIFGVGPVHIVFEFCSAGIVNLTGKSNLNVLTTPILFWFSISTLVLNLKCVLSNTNYMIPTEAFLWIYFSFATFLKSYLFGWIFFFLYCYIDVNIFFSFLSSAETKTFILTRKTKPVNRSPCERQKTVASWHFVLVCPPAYSVFVVHE